jgi:hypothetical protein
MGQAGFLGFICFLSFNLPAIGFAFRPALQLSGVRWTGEAGGDEREKTPQLNRFTLRENQGHSLKGESQ